MAKQKPKFRVGRKLPEAEASTFEERQEQRVNGNVTTQSPPRAQTDAAVASSRGAAVSESAGSHSVDISDSQARNGTTSRHIDSAASGVRSPGGSLNSGVAGSRDYETEAAQDRDGVRSGDRDDSHCSVDKVTPRRGRGGWTKSSPYTRKDGVATRSTTIYLPVDLADRLRRFAFEADRKQSDVVVEALELLLARDSSSTR